MRRAAALLPIVAASCALAQDTTSIGLTGVQIRNATNQSRTSSPDTLLPGCIYDYRVDGFVRGQGGVLGALYPNPTPLATVLDALAPGASAGLIGTIPSPNGGTHPIELINQTTAGTTVLAGITVTYGLTLSGGVRADNIAYFDITNVTLSPAFLVGSLVFTSGSADFTSRFCIADLNRDCSVDLADFFEFFACYDLSLPCADIDGEPGVDLADFFAFFSGFDTGC